MQSYLGVPRILADKNDPILRVRQWSERLSRRIVAHDRPAAEQSDEVLVERSQAGDRGAFTELVERYKHRVHWVVRRMIGSAEDEDLTQEVFLRVYKALPSFRSESKFSTWIYKITRNVCLSELRRRSRHGEHVALEEGGEERLHVPLSGSRHDLEARIEREDLSRKVRELIGRLPVQYRTVLTLYHLNQVNYEEIAEIMEVPLGTVKTYLHRARMRLRNLVLAESDLAELAGEFGERAAGNGG